MADDEDDRLTGEQIRAARALLRWDQPDLETRSGVSLPTIKRLELMEGPCAGRPATIDALRTALEKGGIEFIPANGGGAGVRLRKRRR